MDAEGRIYASLNDVPPEDVARLEMYLSQHSEREADVIEARIAALEAREKALSHQFTLDD